MRSGTDPATCAYRPTGSTAPCRSRSRIADRGSRRNSRPRRSTASRAPTAGEPAREPASAWRSCRRSRRLTAGARRSRAPESPRPPCASRCLSFETPRRGSVVVRALAPLVLGFRAGVVVRLGSKRPILIADRDLDLRPVGPLHLDLVHTGAVPVLLLDRGNGPTADGVERGGLRLLGARSGDLLLRVAAAHRVGDADASGGQHRYRRRDGDDLAIDLHRIRPP